MTRFREPQPWSRRSPVTGSPEDGLAQGLAYTAIVRSASSGGLVQVSIPALHLSQTYQAHIQPGLTPAVGSSCLVVFDEQKVPWVTARSTADAPVVIEPKSITEADLADGAVSEAKLAAAVQAKLTPGAWTSPTGFSAKLEETAGLQVRTEQGAATVRFKGFCKVKEAVPAETALFTLPVGFRPPVIVRLTAIDLNAANALLAYVNPTGVVENHTSLTATHFWSFDDLTFHLT